MKITDTKYIKHWGFIVFLIVGSLNLKAQQEPQYTQYMFNMLSVNPAYAGTREALNVLMLSRLQWIGLDGAPRSNTFAAHTPINNKKIGVGLSVITDNIGPVTNTYMNFNYSHRVKLSEEITLAMGLKGGINNYAVNLESLSLREAEYDPSFAEDFRKVFQPNIGTGAYLYTDKYYVGLSVPKLFQTNLENDANTSEDVSEIKRHYFIAAGYIHELNSEWKLRPSLITKTVQGAPPSTDLTFQAIYNDKYWMGATYRIGDAIAFLMNMQINRQLSLGYSYDVTVSGMNNVTNGSHEILISYDFAGFTNDRVKSPRYF